MPKEHLKKLQRNQISSLESSTGTNPFFSEGKADTRSPFHWDAMPLDTTNFIADWEPEVRSDAQKPMRSITAKRLGDPAFATTVFTAVKLNLSARGKL
jgi:hypothetical protein